MRKWVFLLLTILLAACAQTESATQESPQAAEATAPPTATSVPPTDTPEPTLVETAVPTTAPTVTSLPPFVLGSHYGGVPAGQWELANWEAFLAAHPDVEADIIRSDYYTSFVNRSVHNQITGDDPPDVFTAAMGGALYDYVAQGLIADITDLWETQGWDEVFPASVKEMASVNGRQYFVPTAIQWNGIFYRTDVMAEAGVAPPTTWDELLAACDALNEAGIIPFIITATSRWPPPMGFWFSHINQRLNGPAFHEQLMRGEISYTDSRVRTVFDTYGPLFEHNCFSEQARFTSYGQAIDQFEAGEGAMYAHGEWLYEFIDDETKAVTDFIRFPIIDESVPLGELVPMYGAFMRADTPHSELAREFLIFAAGEASQQSNLETLKRLPSNLNIDRSALLPVYEKGLQMVEEATVLTQLIGANTNPFVASQLYDTISKFWREPGDLDELLAAVEADRLEVYGDVAANTAVSPNFSQASPSPLLSGNSEMGSRVDPGAVVYHGGLFHMFFNRFNRFPGPVEVHYATSTNGQTWIEHEGDPLLTTESVSFAEVAVVASDVIVEPDGTWVLYFHTWQTQSLVNGQGVIGRATAATPLGPWTVDPEPILQMANSPAAWDGAQVSLADVIQVENGYRMYYTGASPSGLMQIGLATSVDGISWEKYDDPQTTEPKFADSDPVIANGETGNWDANAAFTARVVPTASGWLMLYKNLGSTGEGPKMGTAVSEDGIQWTKTADSPIFTSDIVTSGARFALTQLINHEGQLYLFAEFFTESPQTTDIYLLTAEWF